MSRFITLFKSGVFAIHGKQWVDLYSEFIKCNIFLFGKVRCGRCTPNSVQLDEILNYKEIEGVQII